MYDQISLWGPDTVQMPDKCCKRCRYCSELLKPRERSDGAVIYGYCFQDGDKDYSSSMGKGYAIFMPLDSGAICKNYNSIGSYDRLRELAEADKDGRVVVLPTREEAEAALGTSNEKYPEILELRAFCRENGIKCKIMPLYDGHKLYFPDGNDFVQHEFSYGSDEGFVEPAIGDKDFDFSAVGLELAKSLVLKYREQLQRPRRKEAKRDGQKV